MPIRSKLQQRKQSETVQFERVMASLAASSRRIDEEQRAAKIDPEDVGRKLALKFRERVINPVEAFTRPLKTRDVRAIRLAYSMHLFGNYPVPQFIRKAFLDNLDLPAHAHPNQLADDLFMAIRGGKSVWKTVTREFLSKKETHVLTNIRQDFTLNEAMVYSIAMQDCDTPRANIIAKSRIGSLFNHTSTFWREVIRFFARNPCDRKQLNDIIDYLRMQNQATYSIKGRTIATLMRAHEEWVRETARVRELGDHFWTGINIQDLRFTTRDKHEWYIFQITNSKELGAEGTKQRHCVSSYRYLCQRGDIGIFSLRRRDIAPEGCALAFERCLTIEVSSNGKIRQVRGFANRDPLTYENEAVHYWAAQNGMNYNPLSIY